MYMAHVVPHAGNLKCHREFDCVEKHYLKSQHIVYHQNKPRRIIYIRVSCHQVKSGENTNALLFHLANCIHFCEERHDVTHSPQTKRHHFYTFKIFT